MIKYFVIKNFQDSCSSLDMLKGHMLIFCNGEGLDGQKKGWEPLF